MLDDYYKYAYLSLIWGSNNVLLYYKRHMIRFLLKLVSLRPGGQEVIKMALRSINEKVYIIKISIWTGIGLLIYS